MWEDLLRQLPFPPVVTLTGGGGKTGLMYYLVTQLASEELPAVATSTTKLSAYGHSFTEIHHWWEGIQWLKNLSTAPRSVTTLVMGQDKDNPAKMLGIPSHWVDRLAAQFPNTYFLVEGDGSAGRSLKGYYSHEPVIPNSTRLLIPVIGIDVLGAPLSDIYVYRAERVSQMLKVPLGKPITEEMVVRLLFHPEGYLRKCPSHCSVVPFINKVEGQAALSQALNITKGILSYCRVDQVIIGSLKRKKFKRFFREGKHNDH